MRIYYQLCKLFLFAFCIFSISCSKNEELNNKLEEIRSIGNVYPDSAIILLQELQDEALYSNEYTRNKFDLLSIRLEDKAYKLPISDKKIKNVLNFYEQKGSMAEKQEAYYYAGSVYRDLNDVPRALEFFLKSVECGEASVKIDSVMLRNSYSQLYALYFCVQDYINALVMASKESAIARELNLLDARTMLHEGEVLLRVDSISEATLRLRQALEYLEKENCYTDIYTITSLLYHLSVLRLNGEAEKCYKHVLEIQNGCELPASTYLSLGKYFLLVEKVDSAIYCYKEILENTNSFEHKYDASRQLALIYDSKGNTEKANWYAQQFIEISDSLNLGKRQTEAATTNNRYKYLKDKEEEQKLKEEKERYFMTLLVCSFLFIVLVLLLISFFTYKKNLRLKEIIKKTEEIKRIKGENLSLQSEIHMQEEKLSIAKEKIQKNEKELYQMKSDLDKSEIELQMARNKLEERLLQSKSILQLLHQTKFEGNAEGIIDKIRKAAEGKYVMKELDWKQFQNAVNELYPELADKLVRQSKKKISDKQFLFCQLIRVGITNPQIQVLLDMPKATVWRWANKYSWLLDEDYSSEQMSLNGCK